MLPRPLHVPLVDMASTDRVRRHRDQLRKAGMRPIQIWVPDTRSPEFAAEAHRLERGLIVFLGIAD